MSEEDFILRAEKVIKDLEKVKMWYKTSSFTFFIATIALIGSIFLNSYRVGKLEEKIQECASIKGVQLLSNMHKAEIKAVTNLVDDKDKKETIKEVQGMIDLVNDNIFGYAMEVTREVKIK
jgi:mannose/fructose/N-acetylgalactosamine-specific phosphotransferase system component IID